MRGVLGSWRIVYEGQMEENGLCGAWVGMGACVLRNIE